jgi:hypothetical protein
VCSSITALSMLMLIETLFSAALHRREIVTKIKEKSGGMIQLIWLHFHSILAIISDVLFCCKGLTFQ